MNLLINILSVLVESLLLFRITDTMLQYKFSKSKHIYPLLSYILLNFARFLIVQFNLISPNEVAKVLCLISLFIVVFLFYQDHLLNKVLWFCFNYFVTTILEVGAILLVMCLLRVDTEFILHNLTTSIYCLIISKFFNLIVIEYTVRKFRHNFAALIPFKRELFFILLMDFILIIVNLFFTAKPLNMLSYRNEYITLILIIILVISGITILLCYRLTYLANKELEYQLKMQQIELESKLNEDLSAVTKNLRSLRHDMNNHIGIIRGLCEKKEYDLLNDYLNEIYTTIDNANDFIFVGNHPFQILLNSKISKAQQKDIHLETDITVNEIEIPDKDLCALLGNIIDNAIEATAKLETNRYVKLVIKKRNNACYIHCENTFKTPPVIVNGKFLTTKRATLEHGIGTENIKSIVKKYNGTLDFCVDEHFILNIIIPYS